MSLGWDPSKSEGEGRSIESGHASDKHSQPRSISTDDFKEILEERKPSVSLEMVTSYNRWFEAFKAL